MQKFSIHTCVPLNFPKSSYTSIIFSSLMCLYSIDSVEYLGQCYYNEIFVTVVIKIFCF